MILKQPYRNLDHALKFGLRVQVSESLSYVLENFPVLDSPKKIFDFLKRRITYKKDPRGVELFQTVETLLDNNFHGITGAGDCDCFTIAALSTLLANGFTDSGIVLAGRNPLVPVHIWAYTYVDGQLYNLDLTNPHFNTTREYKWQQKIPYVLNQNEKNMLLQLAEGGTIPARYIHFPNSRVKVREDYYDNLSAGEFQSLCLSEGVDVDTLQELSKGRAERKAAKAEIKATKKAAKPRNVRKLAKVDAKAARKQTKADTKQIKQVGKADIRNARGQAKIIRANDPNRGQNFRAFTTAMFTPAQQPDNSPTPDDYAEFYNEQGVEVPEEIFPVPDEQEEFVEVEVPEQEEFVEIAEGWSASKPLLYTGLVFLGGALALGGQQVVKRYRR